MSWNSAKSFIILDTLAPTLITNSVMALQKKNQFVWKMIVLQMEHTAHIGLQSMMSARSESVMIQLSPIQPSLG